MFFQDGYNLFTCVTISMLCQWLMTFHAIKRRQPHIIQKAYREHRCRIIAAFVVCVFITLVLIAVTTLLTNQKIVTMGESQTLLFEIFTAILYITDWVIILCFAILYIVFRIRLSKPANTIITFN